MRRAVVSGRLSWSMASLIAKQATPEDERQWLAEAEGRTVREMRKKLKERHREETEAESPAAESPAADVVAVDALTAESPAAEAMAPEELTVLCVTVDREDAWLFECARMIVRHVSGARSPDETVEALLAEGFSTFSRWLPPDAITEPGEDDASRAQRQWEAQLAQWREEAEEICEARIRGRGTDIGGNDEPADADAADADERRYEGSTEQIDAELRRTADELATLDVVIGKLAERFWRSDGWRRLGYATESQYARERLGASLSTVKAKRALARRIEQLPRLAQAVERHELGFEAARVVARVATAHTVEEWVGRARERTVRHLRDEADAAEMVSRLTEQSAIVPPNESLMAELEGIESAIASGAAFAGETGAEADDGQMSAGAPETSAEAGDGQMFAPASKAADGRMSAAGAGDDEGQMSAPGRRRHRHRALGRVTLRLRVRAETRASYRWLERLFIRHRPVQVPFFQFLCRALIETWKSSLGSDVAYASVYARDRYRCRSPVCSRTDVTPHHLKFRSAGGDDTEENLASLCVWCHLDGIHGGRLSAAPPASSIRWRIGRAPHTEVEGRRTAASRVSSQIAARPPAGKTQVPGRPVGGRHPIYGAMQTACGGPEEPHPRSPIPKRTNAASRQHFGDGSDHP